MRRLTLIIIISGFFYAESYAASFDCAKARTGSEAMICSDKDLSHMDDDMKSAYDRVLSGLGGRNYIRLWQRSWLTDRNSCKDVICLKKAYSSRIQDLNEISVIDPKTVAIAGEYERYFRNKPDKHYASVMVLPVGGGLVRVIGYATWVGNAETGNVNTGDIDDRFPLISNEVRYKDEDDGCSFVIRFSPNVMTISDDSMRCGGMNVTFDGQYRKVMK